MARPKKYKKPIPPPNHTFKTEHPVTVRSNGFLWRLLDDALMYTTMSQRRSSIFAAGMAGAPVGCRRRAARCALLVCSFARLVAHLTFLTRARPPNPTPGVVKWKSAANDCTVL